MKKKFFNSLVLVMIFLIVGCESSQNKKVIVLQPFENFSQKRVLEVQKKMDEFSFTVMVNKPIPFPEGSYYPERNRYRADFIIRFLKDRVGKDTIIIGLTHNDISTTKGEHKDWGVMGLGYRPGKSCVVSTFRLSKKNQSEQLYKVVTHELGHTIGLDHCKEKTCLMRDAEGGNPLDEEKDFWSYLYSKGFQSKES